MAINDSGDHRQISEKKGAHQGSREQKKATLTKQKVKYASIGSHMRTQVNTILKELPAK